MQRKAFLDQEAPPGYVAGLGRGATGFTTQAEWGALQPLPITVINDQTNPADAEDKEADAIFDTVEQQLHSKKGKKRSRMESSSNSNKIIVEDISVSDSIKAISNKFNDAKQELKSVSLQEWIDLPQPIDLTMRNKRLREERKTQMRFYRNSDALSLGLLNNSATDDAIDTNDIDTELNRAKDLVLDSQLKIKEDALHINHDVVDKHQYLRQLKKTDQDENGNNESKKFVSDIGDYQKTRTLFLKLTQATPKKPDNWIAFARLEYDAKKFNRSKEIIQTGCDHCARNEEIWLVNLEINTMDLRACKVIVADAIKYNSKSLKLWLKAIEYERDTLSKTRVIRKALEFLPMEESLWLLLADNENNTSVKLKIVKKATTLISSSISLWLKYSSLESAENAGLVLQKARETIDDNTEDSYILWIEEAKIQERINQNEVKIHKIIGQCFSSIGNRLNYEEWFDVAVKCDTDGFPITTKSLILHLLSHNEPMDINQILDDSKTAHRKALYNLQRSLLFYINQNHPKNLNAWFESIILEKELKDYANLFTTYELALKSHPENIELYLMYAKDKWILDNDTDKARGIIFEGMQLNPQNEDLWFAAIKLEDQAGSEEIALDLFNECKKELTTPSVRVWYKHITLLRKIADNEKALELANEAIKRFPKNPKLYLQKAQIYEELNEFILAKKSYETGIKQCPTNPYLWIGLSQLYSSKLNKILKARSTLDEGISRNPTMDLLHLEKINLESKSPQVRLKILARGLQLVPASGILWSKQIESSKPEEKKTVYAMALKSTRDDQHVILTIAKDLWMKGELEKAKIFFENCLKKYTDFGDCYIYYYAYLLQNGEMYQIKDLESKFFKNDPHHGFEWCKTMKKIDNLDIEPVTLLRESAIEILKKL